MKRLFSTFTACLTALSALPVCCLAASAEAWNPDALVKPDWVPKNFIDAMKFEMEYGATHVEDDVVCVVRRESTNTDVYLYRSVYDTFYTGDVFDDGAPFEWKDTYQFELPEMPPEDDDEARRAVYDLCDEIGLPYSYVENPEENPFAAPFLYTVTAYKVMPATGLNITWQTLQLPPDDIDDADDDPWADGDIKEDAVYSFVSDADGLHETDIYSWLPDCEKEFRAFTAGNEKFIIRDGYIVYADSISVGSYYSSFQEIWETRGNTDLTKRMVKQISEPELLRKEGGSIPYVEVCQPTRAGTVEVSFSKILPNNETFDEQTVAYRVDADGTITPITSEEVIELFTGDANGDGALNVADAVALQRYLLEGGEFSVWQNADMDGNGMLNAIDLTLLKQYLTEQSTVRPSKLTYDVMLQASNYILKAASNPKVTFTAVIAGDELKEAVTAVHLYDADNDTLIAEMQKNEEGVWLVDGYFFKAVTTPCTKHFSIVAETEQALYRSHPIKMDFVVPNELIDGGDDEIEPPRTAE